MHNEGAKVVMSQTEPNRAKQKRPQQHRCQKGDLPGIFPSLVCAKKCNMVTVACPWKLPMYPAQSLAVRWSLEWLREAGTGRYSTHSISTAERQFKIKSILNWNPNIIAGLLSKLLLLIGHTSLCITLDLRRSDVGSWMSHIKCRMSNLRSQMSEETRHI